jgi:hypothetical protein
MPGRACGARTSSSAAGCGWPELDETGGVPGTPGTGHLATSRVPVRGSILDGAPPGAKGAPPGRGGSSASRRFVCATRTSRATAAGTVGDAGANTAASAGAVAIAVAAPVAVAVAVPVAIAVAAPAAVGVAAPVAVAQIGSLAGGGRAARDCGAVRSMGRGVPRAGGASTSGPVRRGRTSTGGASSGCGARGSGVAGLATGMVNAVSA